VLRFLLLGETALPNNFVQRLTHHEREASRRNEHLAASGIRRRVRHWHPA